MKRIKRSLFFVLCLAGLLAMLAGCARSATPAPTATPLPPTATPVPATPTASPQDAVAKLHWFGTSAFLYKGSKIIYFDPITLAGDLPQADIILVTHAHSDHWSVPDIEKIIGPHTTLVISPNVSSYYDQVKTDLGVPATVLAEGQTTEVDGISIQAVPAYGNGHPRDAGGMGYLVSMDGLRLYMAGGTDAYPDMAKYTCDIAFVPVYSKDSAQAMAQVIPARIIVLEHTSYFAAKAVADLFTQSIPGKMFVALQDGPNAQ